jgi:uncharacterized phage protein (TIGR01671 family)
MRETKFEYGFESINGIVKKVYYLSQIPTISNRCDVWNMLSLIYTRQFTGLQDKNEVDIYEGDIVNGDAFSGKNLKCKVIYDEQYGCYQLKSFKEKPLTFPIKSFLKNLEIIGNIHENPELLN